MLDRTGARNARQTAALSALLVSVTLGGCGGTPTPDGTTPAVPPGQSAQEAVTAEAPAEAVRAQVESYLSARLSETEDDSVSFLLPSGLEVFERLRQEALTADEAATRALNPSDRMAVLYLRQIFPRTELTSLSPEQLASHLSEHRPDGREAMDPAAIDRIEVEGEQATVFFILGDVELELACRKLADVWLIDLSASWEQTAVRFNEQFEAEVERSGDGAETLIEDLMQATTGVAFDPALYSPPAG